MENAVALKSWDLYFSLDEYTAFNKEISLIIEIRKLIKLTNEDIDSIIKTRIYNCEYKEFEKFNCLGSTIKLVSCAVSERIFERRSVLILVETRITKMEVNNFSDITINKVDSLVSVIGTVCRVGSKRIENTEVFVECVKCTRVMKVKIKNNLYKMGACECKGKTFVFLYGHPEMKCLDKQDIRIQKVYCKEKSLGTIEVELTGNFVGFVYPGDLIQLVGIIKAELCSDAYKLKLECNNLEIINNRNYYLESKETDFQVFKVFKKISEEENLMAIFIKSLFPNIFGNDFIKAGLILSLFGGTRKLMTQGTTRSEIHVLIVGDPGLGKSKLLLLMSSILPKSTYVSGSFCTTPGLTVSITHDPSHGEYMADAGALVVSDGGFCCIDEFDKIDDHMALFEVMEDQRVTVAKGGVVCSVPTRTTIIAASNPKSGHFDSSKSLKDNLKFESALLSRFDLVFILLDDLNERESYEISSEILKKRMCIPSNKDLSSHENSDENISTNSLKNENNLHVNDKYINLNSSNETVESLVKNYISPFGTSGVSYPKEILRKYIEYSRNTINPVLSKSA